jgi:hypothetical protein
VTRVRAGVLVAVAHAALVGSLGLKLLADRARLPHGWVRTQPFDPSTPLRGRYARLGLEVPLTSADANPGETLDRDVRLAVRNDRVVADPTDSAGAVRVQFLRREDDRWITRLAEPIAFFIPEHVVDPSKRARGEELWAEVTVPKAGPPRPIRLGVMRNGRLTPLELR